MRWKVAVGVLLVVGLPCAFTIGIAVGLAFSGDKDPVESIAGVLGSTGDWVAGLASFAAAWAALFIANRQRQEELPNLAVSVDGNYDFSLTNFGRLPVEVNGRWLYLTWRHETYMLGDDIEEGTEDKALLGHGEIVTFRYGDHLLTNLAGWIHVRCNRDLASIQLVVATPLRPFKFPLPDYLARKIQDELSQIKSKPKARH